VEETMVTAIQRKYAKLNKDDLNKIQSLEKETGTILVAFEKDAPYAALTDEQVKRVQQLEKDLGVILLAFRQ
jgi:hypothetical protein